MMFKCVSVFYVVCVLYVCVCACCVLVLCLLLFSVNSLSLSLFLLLLPSSSFYPSLTFSSLPFPLCRSTILFWLTLFCSSLAFMIQNANLTGLCACVKKNPLGQH